MADSFIQRLRKFRVSRRRFLIGSGAGLGGAAAWPFLREDLLAQELLGPGDPVRARLDDSADGGPHVQFIIKQLASLPEPKHVQPQDVWRLLRAENEYVFIHEPDRLCRVTVQPRGQIARCVWLYPVSEFGPLGNLTSGYPLLGFLPVLKAAVLAASEEHAPEIDDYEQSAVFNGLTVASSRRTAEAWAERFPGSTVFRDDNTGRFGLKSARSDLPRDVVKSWRETQT